MGSSFAIQLRRLHAVFAETEKAVDLFQKSPLLAGHFARDALHARQHLQPGVQGRAAGAFSLGAHGFHRGHAIGGEDLMLRPLPLHGMRMSENDQAGERCRVQRRACLARARVLSLCSCSCI
jgi:hypothetical protein